MLVTAMVAALAIAGLGVPVESTTPLPECQDGIAISTCVRTGGSELDVESTNTDEGAPDNESAPAPAPAPPPVKSAFTADGCRVGADPDDICAPALPDATFAAEPAVTLNDLARFFAAQPVVTGDPVGFGLLNAPANVIASAAEQEVSGELFDRPVRVRFVPVGYTFSYGDGGSRTTETGGATWAAQGLAQFTPTETTHVYRARGVFTVIVTTAYAASVDFGSGWRPVTGTVSATSAGYGIQIVEARTALVARDCIEDPSGVGCPAR